MATYELISTQTVTGATAASIDFTSIPGTWVDLVLVLNARASAAGNLFMKINSTTTTYTNRTMYSLGGTANFNQNIVDATLGGFIGYSIVITASTFGSMQIYLPNYTSTSLTKAYLIDNSTEAGTSPGAGTELTVGLLDTTAAISSISLAPAGTTFVTNSTASLYGIK